MPTLSPKQQWPEFASQPIFFNQRVFRENLASKPSITIFKDAIAGVNTHFDRRLDEGEDIRTLISERATFIDLILHYAWHQFSWDSDICLIAVGGYGRQELHPQSDIDILILLDNQTRDKYKDNLERFITSLWDLGLDIGSSVRTLKQCVQLAKEDITVATNLTEMRRIAGADSLRDQLHTFTIPDKIWPMSEFYHAKLEEQINRHKKYNFTEYDLEPNIKKSPGGLRDIQTVNWIAKRFYNVHTLRQLEGKLFFTEAEFGLMRSAEAFLWKVRYQLHRIAKRPEERLLFEYQRELAAQFGYFDNEQELAVEQFMHEYYRTVLALHELNEVLLQILYERIHKADSKHSTTPLTADFQVRDGYIEVTHVKVFKNNPSALMEIFVLISKNPFIKGMHATTIRLIRESRGLIDQKFRDDPKIKSLFLLLFKIEKGLVRQLKRMKRYGILGLYLPEFGKITGQMQHDLFHRYTVDAHTLLVMNNIRRFRRDDAHKEFPLAAKVIGNIEQPELLYIAALYHDIGKGRGGDHSILGAVDAEFFCKNHGLSGRETRLITWLIKKHLLMSYVSQKRDTSDPDVIYDFALQMGDISHLNYLYALTVADMCGTNPNIWNSWRASLMRQLYTDTKRALRQGLENTVDQPAIIEETKEKSIEFLALQNITKDCATAIWCNMPDDYFVRETSRDISWQTEAIECHKSNDPLILIRDSEKQSWEGATQIFVRVKNTKNVFLAAATALAQLGLNIQDARLYNTEDGYTIDTFYVLDENFQALKQDPERRNKILSTLKAELLLVDEYSTIVHRRTPRQLKQFATPTRTCIHSDPNNLVSVLEVVSPNRHALLATIGHVFLDLDIHIQNAKISTLGERVEDIFFITDANNKPLSDPDLCSKLQQQICQKLDRQVEKDI